MQFQGDDYFLDNPYPYKDASDRIKEDSKFLQQLFRKTKKQIKTASNSYVKNPDGLRNFLFITRSYEHMRTVELSDKATTLAVAVIIFAIDALMMHIESVPRSKRKKPKMDYHEYRLRQYLRSCFSRDDKLMLLNSFVFGARAATTIPMNIGTDRHLMYRGMLGESKDYEIEHNKREFCSPVESTDNIHCGCIKWLNTKDDTKINHYLGLLAKHLYKMRCSIVHEGVAPLISHTEEKPPNFAVWGMTVSDVYFDSKHARHYHYSSALSRKTLERMFTSSLWTAFDKGYPRLSK